MKKEDLMIGDWVNFNGTIDKVQEILYVEEKGYCASFAASATLFPIPLDKITPIPITPEILTEKLGFVVQNEKHLIYDFHIEDKGLVFPDNIRLKGHVKIRFNENPKGKYEFTWFMNCARLESLKIQYIHELQHALKLCKIEKDIVL